MASPKRVLLDETEGASGWQASIFLLAKVSLFAFKRHTSHLGQHVWLITVCIPTLEELVLRHGLILDLDQFLSSCCDRQDDRWTVDNVLDIKTSTGSNGLVILLGCFV